jgi:hypothetical protein
MHGNRVHEAQPSILLDDANQPRHQLPELDAGSLHASVSLEGGEGDAAPAKATPSSAESESRTALGAEQVKEGIAL